MSSLVDDFSEELNKACFDGDMEKIKDAVKKGATNFNSGLGHACIGNKIQAIEEMIKLGANMIKEGLFHAYCHKNKQAMELLIKKQPDSILYIWKLCNDKDKQYIFNVLEELKDINWNSLVIYASEYGHTDLIEKIITTQINVDINGAAMYNSYMGNFKLSKFLIDNCDENYLQLDTILINACHSYNYELILYLLLLGAHIDSCYVRLSDIHIEYLLKKSINTDDWKDELKERMEIIIDRINRVDDILIYVLSRDCSHDLCSY